MNRQHRKLSKAVPDDKNSFILPDEEMRKRLGHLSTFVVEISTRSCLAMSQSCLQFDIPILQIR